MNTSTVMTIITIITAMSPDTTIIPPFGTSMPSSTGSTCRRR
jgi:hypothetical protein